MQSALFNLQTTRLIKPLFSTSLLCCSLLILMGCFGPIEKENANDPTVDSGDSEKVVINPEARANPITLSLEEIIEDAESNTVALPTKYGGRFLRFQAKVYDANGDQESLSANVFPLSILDTDYKFSSGLTSFGIVLRFGTSITERQMVASLKRGSIKTFTCLVKSEVGTSKDFLLYDCSVE